MSDEPVILSADMASELARMHLIRPDHAHKPLEAIAEGRTVVIRKWTEAQVREAWEAHEDRDRPAYMNRAVFFLDASRKKRWHGWLACARALGAIVEDGT